MDVTQIGNYAAQTKQTGNAGAVDNSGEQQKMEFLQLLVTQMRHQDPMDPIKQEEYAAQLAQFSSLEQLTSLNQRFDQMYESNTALNKSITNALSTTLIGKNVNAMVDEFTHNSEEPAGLNFRLASAAEDVKLKVKNADGNILHIDSLGTLAAGEHVWQWDGKYDGKGQAVDGENYYYEVVATTGDERVDVVTNVSGKITGVEFGGQGTMYFLVGNVRVPTDRIQKIYTPDTQIDQ